MDPQRLEDIACLLAVLMLPAACSDGDDATVGDSTADGSTGAPTTSSDGSTTTSADGGTTGGDATAADATNDASTAGTSSGLGGSSSDTTESSATADETTGTETGGNVGPLCEAYAQNIENCYPDRVDPVEVGQQCEMWFDAYATHGQDCLDAAEALFMCRAEASCQELERDLCFPFLNTVVAECG